MFDSGSSLIHLPKMEYNNLIFFFWWDKKCKFDDKSKLVYCYCESIYDKDWPTININLGGSIEEESWYTLEGQDYLLFHPYFTEY